MATTFYKGRINGVSVTMVSFYAGLAKGRSIALYFGKFPNVSNKNLQDWTVKAMRRAIDETLKIRGGVYTVTVGNGSLTMRKREIRKFAALLDKWLSGEPLREVD